MTAAVLPRPPAPSGRARVRLRAALPLVLLGAAVVAVAAVAGPGPSGAPLDPRSTAPDGTRALVQTLSALGADVRVGVPRPVAGDDVALLFTDRLGEARRQAVLDWVRAGGVLVVADPRSELTPRPVGPATVAGAHVPMSRSCDVAALAAVGEVAPGGAVYEAPAGAEACFARRDGHWLVVRAEGDGVVVALGGPDVFVNARLDSADHARLAAALLAPHPGTRLALLRPARPGEGEATLGDLVPTRVRLALGQLAVGFVILAAWRARRLGAPAVERQPVDLPASELVVATGNLLHQARARRRAATLLREDLRRTLGERLGLPPGTAPDDLADAVATRTGVDRGEVAGVLAAEAGDEEALVVLARSAERVRRAATAVPSGRPGGGAP